MHIYTKQAGRQKLSLVAHCDFWGSTRLVRKQFNYSFAYIDAVTLLQAAATIDAPASASGSQQTLPKYVLHIGSYLALSPGFATALMSLVCNS